MGFQLPKGWEKDSDKLFIHDSGVRIQRMLYRQKDGWFIVPVDLDQPVIEFEPTPEGRDKAFEAYAKGQGVAKTKKPAKVKAKTKKVVEEEAEEEAAGASEEE